MSDLKIDYPTEFTNWENYLKDLDELKALPKLPEVNSDQLRYFLSSNGIYVQYYEIQSSEESLKKYNIYAPFEGAVTSVSFEVGDLISPNKPLGSLSRTDVYEIVSTIPLSQTHHLKAGKTITMKSAVLQQSWKARVDRIGTTVDESTQSIKVYLKVSGKGIKEGMYLEGSLETETLQQVTELPKEVLSRENQVYTVQDGVVQSKKVTPLVYMNESVWVQGLLAGDVVITEQVVEPIEGIKITTN